MGDSNRTSKYDIEYLLNQVAETSHWLIDQARCLAWGPGGLHRQEAHCEQIISRRDRTIRLVYGHERGQMTLHYDADGINEAKRGETVFLERIGRPGPSGECAWRVMGGAVCRGVLDFRENGDLVFDVLNGDRYVFVHDGTRQIQRANEAAAAARTNVRSDRSGDRLESPLSTHEFLGWLREFFKTMDTDRDGKISSGEVIEVISNFSGSKRDAAMLSVLAREFRMLAGLEGNADSFGLEALSELKDLLDRGGADKRSQEIMQALIEIGDRLKTVNRKLWGEFSSPFEAVQPQAISQSWLIGDCTLLAVLSAMTNCGKDARESIVKMITPLADGKYSVKFPGKEEAVVVGPLEEADIVLFNSASKYGTWVIVLEKAVLSVLRNNTFRKSGGKELLDGLNPPEMIKLLTGFDAKCINVADSDPQSLLLLASQWGLPVIAGRSGGIFEFNGRDEAGIYSGHAYAVHYDPATGKVIVRNPWGAVPSSELLTPEGQALDGCLDGCVTLSAEDFKKSFSHMYIGLQ